MTQPFLTALWQHLVIVCTAVGIAACIAVPLGVVVSDHPRVAGAILFVDGVVMTIPSVALYGLLMPVLALVGKGIGTVPAVIAMILYSQLPMLRNTVAGIRNVDRSVIDAARGIGMGKWRILATVSLPLAFPVIMAGIRSSFVMGVGVTAIAAYIGAGGLGMYIMLGIANSNRDLIVTGALATTFLALLADLLLGRLQRVLERRMGKG
ncbi:ABC transporter permease [Aminiphilus circumscriptus]|jgi:osmoprotectant transport system permease protein|uniref:ABC transporter permease n=1 Tax=Aminiphilus circumscriptus TaxID=290732 RepID=UPI0004785AF9|nr:ABC transporter permease [Aminiphilus circumscriptus]